VKRFFGGELPRDAAGWRGNSASSDMIQLRRWIQRRRCIARARVTLPLASAAVSAASWGENP